MSRRAAKSTDRHAKDLSALLEAEMGQEGDSERVSAAERSKAVRSIRALSDDALLDTLHELYRSGKHAAGKATGQGGGNRKKRRGRQRHERREIVQAVTAPSAKEVVLWLCTAFLAGAIIMGLELVAFRLYAPYFGYTIHVWGIMISVVMAALAAGYAIGGRLADRSRTDMPLYVLILASALYQLAILMAVRALLPWLARHGEFSGTLAATLIVFVPPMTALATAGPFIIRLLTRVGYVGRTAGGVYALSTVGSIVGILVTSFYLVPRIGTQWTLATACAASAALGVLGLIRHRWYAPTALVLLATLVYAPGPAWGENTRWVTDSPYNLVRVVEVDGQLRLILNDERSVATRLNERTGWTGGYFDDFALGPLLTEGDRGLVLGMGAGASMVATWRTDPTVTFDAVEIDPAVVDAAYRFFGLSRTDERLSVYTEDARPWVAESNDTYDIVHIDLYQGGPYIPFYLVTQEFFAAVRERMAPRGVLMMNVLDGGPDRELLNAVGATLHRAFQTVVYFSRPSGNHIVLAFPDERPLKEIRQALDGAGGSARARQHAHRAALGMAELDPPADALVLTDDFAPVEAMTRRMLASVATYRDRGG